MKRIGKLLTTAMAILMVVVFACTCGKSGGDTPAPAGSGSSAAPAPAATGVNDGSGKILRVAMECGYAPYNWTQSDDSNGAVPIVDSSDYAYGYDVMMAKKLAEAIKGMQVESWEVRERSNGTRKVYVRFTQKEPVVTVDVSQSED